MKLAISTDHAGFEMLRQLEPYLVGQGHKCIDFGPAQFNGMDDYPDFIFPAARAVASGECEAGIILGASGQGEAMAANRVKGVRCALFYGIKSAPSAIDVEGNIEKDKFEILRLTREHNNANMLSLGARFVSLDEAKQALDIWLNTSFSKAERHIRRIAKLDQGGNESIPKKTQETIQTKKEKAETKEAPKPEQAKTPKPKKDATIDDDGTLNVTHDD